MEPSDDWCDLETLNSIAEICNFGSLDISYDDISEAISYFDDFSRLDFVGISSFFLSIVLQVFTYPCKLLLPCLEEDSQLDGKFLESRRSIREEVNLIFLTIGNLLKSANCSKEQFSKNYPS